MNWLVKQLRKVVKTEEQASVFGLYVFLAISALAALYGILTKLLSR